MQFVFCRLAICQIEVDESFLEYNDKALIVNKAISQNAELLVNHLIKGKTTDKEKFDILFKWVTLNIRYSHSEFYEPIEYSPQSISRILKTKSTICLGYPQLMDTLCKLADLKNVTIFGYGKNEIFDVGDSIYMHNHAWNAVSLDGLWYLYDITWSLRQSDYRLTKWGERVVRFLERHPEKLKKKKLRRKRYKNLKNDCDKEYKKQRIYYYKPSRIRGFVRYIAVRIPYRAYRKYYKGASTDFYLSDPKTFSITHIADDPIWNFLGNNKIHELVNDSAFYFLNDSSLKHQNRRGVSCKECDDYYDLINKEKLNLTLFNSQNFNSNNKFIKLVCEEGLYNLYFKDYVSLSDSTQKKSALDSAIVNIERSMITNQQCKRNFSLFIKYQKNKNYKKKVLLLEENKRHILYVKNNVKMTLTSGRNIKEVLNKTNALTNVYINKAKQVNGFNTEINPNISLNYSGKRIDKLEFNVTVKQDSLIILEKMILQNKEAFDSLIVNLSLNIWQYAFFNDSIEKPFEKRIKLRYRFKDNYKKEVVDIGKIIHEKELQYSNSIKYILFTPTQECVNYFNEITYLLKLKIIIQNDLLNNMREQAKAKLITEQDLEDFKNNQVNNWVQNICWLNFNKPKLITTYYGYLYMSQKQKKLIDLIQRENDVERNRYSKINHALKLGFRAGNSNISFVKRRLKVKYKKIKKYLKT